MDDGKRRVGRPRKYATEQERKDADAERKRRERLDRARANPENAELVAALDALVPPEPVIEESPPPPSVVARMPTIEEYVAEAVYGAELHYSQASPNATDSTKSLGAQIENAEYYARWRYAGVLEGSVNGL